MPCDSEEIPYLTPFGTLFRYEDEAWGLPEGLATGHLLKWAEGAVAWARSTIEDCETR